MSIKLQCVGVSFRTASFDQLSKISFASYEAEDFLRELSLIEGFSELMVLATCNRLEIYAFGSQDQKHGFEILEKLAHKQGVAFDQLVNESYILTGTNAMKHLFGVACGTDSLIVGELEILSQMRCAIDQSRSLGLLDVNLNRIAQKAIEVGRKARQDTNISRGHLSISSEAVAIAGEHLGTFENKTAVILGSGEIGEITAKVLAKSTPASIVICNRTAATAHKIASELSDQANGRCQAVGFEDIVTVLQAADLVVCATGAPHYILNESMLRMVLQHRPNQKTVLLDLSIPKNIDPAVASLPGITLLTIEDLQQKAKINRASRETEIEKVNLLINAELQRFISSERRLPSQELTSELRREIEAIRKRHVETYQNRFPEEARNYLDTFTGSMVSQILHRLTKNLKNVDPTTEEGKIALQYAQELFNVGLQTNLENEQSSLDKESNPVSDAS